MDPRCREHAEIIVDHSVEIEPGDQVVVDTNPAAEELLIALHEAIGDRGGGFRSRSAGEPTNAHDGRTFGPQTPRRSRLPSTSVR